jgi:hypothetical protein
VWVQDGWELALYTVADLQIPQHFHFLADSEYSVVVPAAVVEAVGEEEFQALAVSAFAY